LGNGQCNVITAKVNGKGNDTNEHGQRNFGVQHVEPSSAVCMHQKQYRRCGLCYTTTAAYANVQSVRTIPKGKSSSLPTNQQLLSAKGATQGVSVMSAVLCCPAQCRWRQQARVLQMHG
jgi:hypothetical protein